MPTRVDLVLRIFAVRRKSSTSAGLNVTGAAPARRTNNAGAATRAKNIRRLKAAIGIGDASYSWRNCLSRSTIPRRGFFALGTLEMLTA
jgi:hypothetical protein